MGKWGPQRNQTKYTVITKNNGRQWENADLSGTKQNTYRLKGFVENYSQM